LDFSSCTWIPNRNLQRNYDAYLNNNHPIFQDDLELEIFEFFFQLYKQELTDEDDQETILFNKHIRAYLQYPSLKACKNRWYKFHFRDDPERTWTFYRELADQIIEDIALIEKMVQRYRRSSNFSNSLEKYLAYNITGELRKRFHQETGYGRSSPWRDLKDMGKKRLTQKLNNLGINDKTQIDKHIRARDYFYHIYSQVHLPNTPWERPPSPLDKPIDKPKNNNHNNNNQIYEDVFERAFEYAQEQEINQENRITTLEEFIQLIDNCSKALKPPRHFPSSPSDEEDSPHQYLLEPLKSVIKEEFCQLDGLNTLILSLTQVFSLSQNDIVKILHRECGVQPDRSTISRWLNRFHQQLLTAIAEYLQREFLNQQECQLTPEMLVPVEQALKEDFKPQKGVYIKQHGKQFLKRKIMISYHSSSQNSSALSPIQYCEEWLNKFLPTPPTPRQQRAMEEFIEEFENIEEMDCDSS
jgi:hypothetical protein